MAIYTKTETTFCIVIFYSIRHKNTPQNAFGSTFKAQDSKKKRLFKESNDYVCTDSNGSSIAVQIRTIRIQPKLLIEVEVSDYKIEKTIVIILAVNMGNTIEMV